MSNAEKIAELRKQLTDYSPTKEDLENKEIKDLKKQIRAKKYARLKQTGRNIKIIGKNIGVGFKAVGKGFEKAIGEDKNKPKLPAKKVKTINEIMAELPQ